MLEYNAEKHEYILDGKKLLNVTTLLQKYGLSPDYSGVSPKVLEAKARYGTIVHSEIEEYIKKGELGITIELQEFIRYIKKNKLAVLESEYRVYNDFLAGTLDLLLLRDEKPVIADIKTTSTIHYDSVSWQLSIYLYLLLQMRANHSKWVEYEEFTGECYHFTKDKELEVVRIPLKPKAEVEKLLNSAREEKGYELQAIDTDLLIKAEQLQQTIAELDARKKEADSQLNELKAELKKAMELYGIKEYSTDGMKITYVNEYTKNTVDTNGLKNDHPRIYNKYLKETKVKSTIKITLKENKDE